MTQKFTRFLLPELAGDDRVISSHMCWDAESFDHNWIMSYHPATSGSLFVATGGSGHSFKNIVNIGKYVVQGLEDRLEPEYRDMWAWRPHAIGVDKGKEERASRPKLELKEATGWKHETMPLIAGEVEIEQSSEKATSGAFLKARL
jgi:sarcosine oxidase/L-pipecolate oxidase